MSPGSNELEKMTNKRFAAEKDRKTSVSIRNTIDNNLCVTRLQEVFCLRQNLLPPFLQETTWLIYRKKNDKVKRWASKEGSCVQESN